MPTATRSINSRQFIRVPFKRPLRFHTAASESFCDQMAQDLSQGGVRFMASEFLPINSQVTVRIQLEDRTKVLDVEGRVVWVRYNPMAENYQIGLEFINEADFQRGTIGKFVRST